MSRPVIAVYSGTFDPLTLGHEDVVHRAAQMFDKVVVAVAAAHHKKTLVYLGRTFGIGPRGHSRQLGNVSVVPFSGLLCDFVRKVKAQASLFAVCAPSPTTITKHKWRA
jgi:pantetheine-phosphate adenylyltransferase